MRFLTGVLLGVMLVGGGAVGYVRLTGVTATAEPGEVEVRVMRWLRDFATPADLAARQSPAAPSPEALAEVLAEARAHYADHCATCHGADGGGHTAIAHGLSPRPPDLRAAATQSQTDGALFHVIEHGVRFTGMPGFATGTAEGEAASWALVRLIRTMPTWTAAEVAAVTAAMPRPAAEIRREIAEEQFLAGGTP